MVILKAFEFDVLLVFFLHSMDTSTYPKNIRSHGTDIFAFYNGKEICRNLFSDHAKYDKAFEKLVKLEFIKDWLSFQHLSYKGIRYLNQ